eukprot:PhF_6_TR40036/c0_g1_i1/m.59409
MADEDNTDEVAARPENPFLQRITTPELFAENFREDYKLFCIVALSTQCALCKPYENALHEVSMAQPENEKIRFSYFNVEECPEAAKELKLFAVPSVAFGMSGEVWESFTGNNVEKFKGMLKNNQAKRNDKMKDQDKARAEAAKAAAAADQAKGDDE